MMMSKRTAAPANKTGLLVDCSPAAAGFPRKPAAPCRRRLPALLVLCLLMLVGAYSPARAGGSAAPAGESITVQIKIPDYRVVKNRDGNDVFVLPGLDNGGRPGDPLLPVGVANIALPPDVVAQSVTVSVEDEKITLLPGAYAVAPAPPAASRRDGQIVLSWGENAGTIVNGRNRVVYERDAFFPDGNVAGFHHAQMRKWRLIRISYAPLRYNPVRKQIQLASEMTLRIGFQRRGANGDASLQAELRDTVMDAEAARILQNYQAAGAWYAPAVTPAPAAAGGAQGDTSQYVIITTNAIVAASAKLADFINYQKNKGWTVETVTETQYGILTGQAPNGAAEKIRQWLKDNYIAKQIQYVLLVGNPHPTDGDVPMKMCWPRHDQSTDKDSPTDYFYADLTGNWDLNGNQVFGEYNGDRGAGGVDFTPEVLVGRLPVYSAVTGWAAQLDAVLQKIMDYGKSADTAWRYTALLPESYSDASTDGAYLGEYMKKDYLQSRGFASFTMYQQGTGKCAVDKSAYGSDGILLGGTKVREQWKANTYGLVAWWGHGSQTGAYVGYGSCDEEQILESTDTAALNDAYPSLVFQVSCSNGYPENNDNLGYALLKNGAAATVSASRVSWYSMGVWSPGRAYADNAALGYYYMKQITGNAAAGAALYNEKKEMLWGWGGDSWMNLMDFNLYGDPLTNINYVPPPGTPLAWGGGMSADLFLDRGADSGIWSYNGAAWTKLTGWTPANMTAYAANRLAGVFTKYDTGNGIWAYNHDTGAWSKLSDWKPAALAAWGAEQMAATFTGYDSGNGIWNYNGSNWGKLSDWLPVAMTGVGDNAFAAKFTSYASSGNGIWLYNGAGWTKITDWNPDKIIGWGTKLIASFTGYDEGNGIWQYDGAAWTKLTDWLPADLAVWQGGARLAAVFKSYGSSASGIWIFDGANWRQATNWIPANLSRLGTTQLVGAFARYDSGNGIWKYDGANWTKITDWLPAAGNFFGNNYAAAFNSYGTGNGIWQYDGAGWIKITDWLPAKCP